MVGVPLILDAVGPDAATPLALLLAIHLPVMTVIATLLLEYGADCNARSPSGDTTYATLYPHHSALDLAARHGHLDVAQLLLNVGGMSSVYEDEPFHGAIEGALRADPHIEVARIIARFAFSKGYIIQQEHQWLLIKPHG